jgi:adenylate kinase
MRLVILGPPGAGKGTQAKIISKIYCIPVVTTGDILREAVSRKTDNGKLADYYMKKGELVPDEIVINIIENRLNMHDVEKGFILDGFPRNISQAKALNRILTKKGVTIDAVLKVETKNNIIISRLSQRRSCPNCSAVYHLKNNPPKINGVCNECGAKLIQRKDDEDKIIKNRLTIYEKQTSPILDLYIKTGKLKVLNGEIELEKIPDQIRQALKDLN